MALDADAVRHVAVLSRLQLSAEELDLYARQLGEILTYVEQLNELDTTNIEPMISATASGNVFRRDERRSSLPREEALAAAPEHDGELFRVPRVIENE